MVAGFTVFLFFQFVALRTLHVCSTLASAALVSCIEYFGRLTFACLDFMYRSVSTCFKAISGQVVTLAAIYELCISSLACCRGMHNVKYIVGIVVHTKVRSPWIRCPNRQKSTGRLPRGADRHKTNSTNIKSRSQQPT